MGSDLPLPRNVFQFLSVVMAHSGTFVRITRVTAEYEGVN